MLNRFELTKPTVVKLDHSKSRKENHGDVLVNALDLSLTLTANQSVLEMIDPELLTGLYRVVPLSEEEEDADSDGDDESGGEQAEMDLPIGVRPYLRFPHMKYPVMPHEGKELIGYTLRLDYGLGGDSDHTLHLCVLKKFGVTPIEGGSVEISWHLSTSADITDTEIGIFGARIQENITITLLKPNEVPSGVIKAGADSGAPGTGPAADEPQGDLLDGEPQEPAAGNTDATMAFINAHSNGAAH